MVRSEMKGERLYFRSPNINVCIKAGVTGYIEKERFHKTVDHLYKRHPIIKAVIEIDSENKAWYLPESGSVSVEFFDSKNGFTWQQWFKETDNIPFNFQKGPLVKVGVFYEANHTDIVILGHHVIGDGLGYLNLMKDMLFALDGNFNESPQMLIQKYSLKQKVNLGFLPKLYAKKINKTWVANKKVFTQDDYLAFFDMYRKKYPPGMFLFSLSEGDLSVVVSSCRKARITVNEAIATAFIAAIQKTDEEYCQKYIKVGVAANIRNELVNPVLDCMGNYVTGISTKFKYDNNSNFHDNARNMAKLLRKKLNNRKSRYLAVNFINELDSRIENPNATEEE